jgi:hypothetical protein
MTETRKYWLDTMLNIVTPLLKALSEDRLKAEMPVESVSPVDERKNYTYLEGFGRVVVGIAPWLATKKLDEEEETLRQEYAAMVRKCLDVCVDPAAKDRMNFSYGKQPIVDAAFLAEGILRAPEELWQKVSEITKTRLLDAMRETRTRKPTRSNWLLFSAMIEAFLHHANAPDWDPMRIDYALMKHAEWYKGDGWYGDGEAFHWDYYNSFVIQPMQWDVLNEVKHEYPEWEKLIPEAQKRLARYATHLEHLISPEGTYPLIGRSLSYRFGAFHALAAAAWNHNLEANITPSQVRCGLTAVIKRILAFDDMTDENGWLRVGVCGHQPGLGEGYISTGSLYLCTAVFLPLGLPESDPFWSDPDAEWTMKALWRGVDYTCQKALK